MPYTDPPTWLAGNPLPASDLNTYVRDNIRYLYAGLGLGGWVDATAETWTYASTDGPTFAMTVPTDATTKYAPGMRIRLKQSGGAYKYFIITAVTATQITMYGGTDYTLANVAVANQGYAIDRGPLGFPFDPAKWTQTLVDTTDQKQTGTVVQNTWYNPGALSIAIPIGVWNVEYSGALGTPDAGKGLQISLSTQNNAESDVDFTARVSVGSGNTFAGISTGRRKTLTLAAKTTYYLILRGTTSGLSEIGIYGSTGAKTIVRAVSALL